MIGQTQIKVENQSAGVSQSFKKFTSMVRDFYLFWYWDDSSTDLELEGSKLWCLGVVWNLNTHPILHLGHMSGYYVH